MAINWSNLGSGAASGAAVGSSISPGWGTAIGAGIGGLSSLFGGDDEDEADKLLKQIPEQLRPYFEQYIKAGQKQLPNLTSQFDQLTNDPGSLIKKFGAGYKESPGYKWRINQGEQAINNAYAAGGMSGTNAHGQTAGTLAENLANQDYQDYLNSALGLFGTGISGEQNLAQMGQTAATDYGNTIGNNLGSRAGLKYERGAQGNQNMSQALANWLYLLNKKA